LERSRILDRPPEKACARRGVRCVLIAGLLCALFSGRHPARAQEPEVIHLPQQPTPAPPSVAPPTPRASVNVEEVLGELWFRRKGYLEKGEVAQAERQVELMREVVRREGILSAEDISAAFLVDGLRSLEAGNDSRALQSFQIAKDFAPDRPGPYFAVARALWSRERDLGGAFSSILSGLRITLRNPASRVPAVGNLLIYLGAGSLLAAALWCFIAALRTARLAQHDLYEGRKRSFSNNAAQGIAWALWLLPALFWITGPWILVYWLALAFAYMSRTDRALSILACTAFIAALPLLGWITRESKVTTDPSVKFLLDAARGPAPPDRIPALEQMAAANPGVPLYRFLLAQSYHANGSVEASLQEYRQIQSESPGNAAAWINSGNIFFEQGQFLQAAEEYRRAVQADGKSALAQFNLSVALQAGLRLEEAEAAARQARALDNAWVTSILSSGGPDGRKEPVEARYSGKEVLAQLPSGGSRIPAAFWQSDWTNPFTLSGGLGLLGCLVAAWGAERWGLGRAQRCSKCGQPFCRRCQVGMRREEGYCTACRHLFVLKDPTAPRVRAERERMVAAHERWQWICRRLVSLVLPGAGQIQGGRVLLGASLLWLTSLSVSVLLLSHRLLAVPGVRLLGSSFGSRIFPVGIIALSWLVGNTLAFDKKGRA
jgi:tetratricopeptide (TPR) repeat protein